MKWWNRTNLTNTIENSRFLLLTKIISRLGLLLTIISLILVFDRAIAINTGKALNLFDIVMLIFSSSFWINKEKKV